MNQDRREILVRQSSSRRMHHRRFAQAMNAKHRLEELVQRITLATACVAIMVAGCQGAQRPEEPAESGPLEAAQNVVTFSRHVAPIIYKHCGTCHRPGQSGPFSLLTYTDLRTHAADVVKVTESRFMPPWLPAKGDVEFMNARRLKTAEIDLLREWWEAGSPEGDRSDLPPLPNWTADWQLGTPDLVVSLSAPYTLQSEGTDIYRNFVLPVVVGETRYVQAIELRPGNPRVVHHAQMAIDETDSCRKLDAADTELGFGGMDMGESYPPGGFHLGWSPGKMPRPHPDNLAWKLEPGADLVLQLHMRPTGKREEIQPTIGFHFAAEPPVETAFGLQIRANDIDIPAGDDAYLVRREFELPIDVKLLSIYPHAHYICREIKIDAHLPGTGHRELLRIPQWDFNWQDEYSLATPFLLPEGTRLTMEYTYDNSTENVRNPNQPPKRVKVGNRSQDEMGNLWLQLLPVSANEMPQLKEAAFRFAVRTEGTHQAHFNLGTHLQGTGRHEQALEHLRRAVEINPQQPLPHHNLAGSLAALGQIDEAIIEMRVSIQIDPDSARAHSNLGNFLVIKKRYGEALRCYERALKLDPSHAQARQNLNALRKQRVP